MEGMWRRRLFSIVTSSLFALLASTSHRFGASIALAKHGTVVRNAHARRSARNLQSRTVNLHNSHSVSIVHGHVKTFATHGSRVPDKSTQAQAKYVCRSPSALAAQHVEQAPSNKLSFHLSQEQRALFAIIPCRLNTSTPVWDVTLPHIAHIPLNLEPCNPPHSNTPQTRGTESRSRVLTSWNFCPSVSNSPLATPKSCETH